LPPPAPTPAKPIVTHVSSPAKLAVPSLSHLKAVTTFAVAVVEALMSILKGMGASKKLNGPTSPATGVKVVSTLRFG